MRRIHPIEVESYRILRGMVDLSHLGPLSRAVAERVIHASADPDYAQSLILEEVALEGGLDALQRDAPVVTDVGMVAAGITGRHTRASSPILAPASYPNDSASRVRRPASDSPPRRSAREPSGSSGTRQRRSSNCSNSASLPRSWSDFPSASSVLPSPKRR